MGSCKKNEGKKYIVIAVHRVVSYAARSTMTAGNAGWAVALSVCESLCVRVLEGEPPFTYTCFLDYHSVLSIQPDSYFPFLPF